MTRPAPRKPRARPQSGPLAVTLARVDPSDDLQHGTQSIAAQIGPPPLHPAPHAPSPAPIGREDYADLVRLYGDDAIGDDDLPSYRSVLCSRYRCCEAAIIRAYPRALGWTCHGCLNVPAYVWIYEPCGPTPAELAELKRPRVGNYAVRFRHAPELMRE